MKENLFAALCCVFMIGLFGCQQAEEIKSSNEELRMSIEASIGKDGAVAGRTVTGNNGSVSFANGDEIGLFVNNRSVVKWTYSGQTWGSNGDVYWDNKVDNHDFCAFYPYVSGATLNDVPMPILTGQTGSVDGLAQYDFLYATKEQNYIDGNPDGTVSFSGINAFEHAFSLISINLKGEGDLVGSTINTITISGTDIVTPYAFSFENLDAVSVSDEPSGVNQLVASVGNVLLTSEGATFYFIVNVGTVALENVSLSIGYTKEDNKIYEATYTGMKDNNSQYTHFVSGKQYSYSLKVNDGVLSISGNEINDWENGVVMNDIIINGNEVKPTPTPES